MSSVQSSSRLLLLIGSMMPGLSQVDRTLSCIVLPSSSFEDQKRFIYRLVGWYQPLFAGVISLWVEPAESPFPRAGYPIFIIVGD